MGDPIPAKDGSAAVDEKIRSLGDWRGRLLARLRKIIHAADPDILEDCKWRGTPTWSHDGLVCTGEAYKDIVKMTFAKGASLKDPASLFNSGLAGKTRRAIDIHEGDEIDETALQELIRAAVAHNTKGRSKPGTGGVS